ncbi:putative Crystallin J1A [Cardiosporidium cionae]|uniref:Crystallin J1A n=1 Tax=Cardiosporidium cionae TaxID=476202 RepID=A0ABQ7J770_9APIC|nr:putative Crystallin J1A [Cardiosporidium cionae]|eukprot:KAF8819833.1 putative Crystallin J1A [Cardiosporidium cionae]
MSIKGAILGLFTADAASVNSHWLYPKFFSEKYAEFVEKANGAPEFIEPIYNPFYRQPLSPYASQSIVLLESLIAKNGFDRADYAARLFETFGPNTVYDNPPKVVNPLVGNPVQGGMCNASIRNFLQVYKEKGAEGETGLSHDNQADGYSKIPIIVAFYAGNPNLPKIIEEILSVTQDCTESLRTSIAAARLFEAALQGKFTAESFDAFLNGTQFQDGIIETTRKELQTLHDATTSLEEFSTNGLGNLACTVPGSFYTALYSLRNSMRETTTHSELFLKTIRDTILLNGCNASRASYLGALLGAAYGLSIIPDHFLTKTQNVTRYKDLANKLEVLTQK